MRQRFSLVLGGVLTFLCATLVYVVVHHWSPVTVVDVRSTFTLEYAQSESARELGLGYRDALASHHGMLFIFDTSGVYPFWMKGMKFPLDIIWINHGVVQDIAQLDPPKTDAEAPAWHVPTGIADRVLEINAGEASAFGIRPGVRLLLPELR